MSTRATLFLTRDNEHCYYETASPTKNEDGQVEWDIHLEIDSKNLVHAESDKESTYLVFKPGTEIYKLIERMDIEHIKPVELPTRADLIRDLKIAQNRILQLEACIEASKIINEALENRDWNPPTLQEGIDNINRSL